MQEFRTTIMRGGTSKGLFFLDSDLPTDPALRDKVCCKAFGGPDPFKMQINGLGGPFANMNKLAIVSKREGEKNAVNYEFGQIEVQSPVIGKKSNCGNISSAVGPFAIEMGIVDELTEPYTTVKIYNTNTDKYIIAHVPVKDGKVQYEGDFSIAGCPGTGSKIQLDFLDPAGAATGKLLPTGHVRDVLHTPDFGDVEVSIIDAANPFVFVRAADLGFKGNETGAQIDKGGEAFDKMMQVRESAAVLLGWAADVKEAKKVSPAMPKVCFVAPPMKYISLMGKKIEAADYDISARMIEFGKGAEIMALTGCICIAVASKIKDCLVWECLSEDARERNSINLSHPCGLVPVDMDVTEENGEYIAKSATVYRTARKMMTGTVSVMI